MQLTPTFVALLSVVTAGLAVPTTVTHGSGSALVVRHGGGIYRQLKEMGHDTKKFFCRIKEAAHCYKEEMKEHLHAIKSDIHQDFREWKAEVHYDFEVFIKDCEAKIDNFEVHYEEFKEDIGLELKKWALNAEYRIEFAAWDIKFHLGWFWEYLATLEVDIREDVYLALIRLSQSLHHKCHLEYQETPQSCGAVLYQIQTLYEFQSTQIDVTEFGVQLAEIHQIIYKSSIGYAQFGTRSIAELD